MHRNKNILVWDLGATKCAAAVMEYDGQNFFCQKEYAIKLRSCHSLTDLVQKIESHLEMSMRDADAICIGGAGQYVDEHLILETPYPYPMPFGKIARQSKWPPFAIVHDYTPIVCATFTSYMHAEENIIRLNDTPIDLLGRRVALGIGTGLGLKDSVFIPKADDFWLGTNEIGHIGIPTPPTFDKRHQALLHFLQHEIVATDKQTITFEKILSGQGLVRLYQFLYGHQEKIDPEWVGQAMHAGKAPELVALFAWYLGFFVGTVQLIFMPHGGIWITGGVALNHLQAFHHAEFQKGIEATPAYLDQRQQFPLGILRNPQHAFFGGAFYAVKKL